MRGILKKIKEEIKSYQGADIEVAKGYSFNPYNLLNQITLYDNGQFVGSKTDGFGRRKFFKQVISFRRDNIKAGIDVDTKHIRVLSKKLGGAVAAFKALLCSNELKHWMTTHYFGKILNEMALRLMTYGTVVLKLTDNNTPDVVNLSKIYLDHSVEKMCDSWSVIEEHDMSPEAVSEMKKWDNVDELIADYQDFQSKEKADHKNTYIKVYERYGYVQEGKKYIYKLQIVAPKQGETNKGEVGEFVLFDKKFELKNLPYRECHINKRDGRWLGVGVYEQLLDAQIKANEREYQKSRSMEISSKHLFNTQDTNVQGNVVTDLDNGDIIVSTSPITPIASEERNLNAFQLDEAEWDKLADRITFSFALTRGEDIPSTMPATNALIQDRNAKSVIGVIRQDFSSFVREVVFELVLPRLIKNINRSHILRISSDAEDIKKLDELFAEIMKRPLAEDLLKNSETGYFDEDYGTTLEGIKQSVIDELQSHGTNNRTYNVPDSYYDLDWDIDVVVDNEEQDIQLLSNNIQGFLQVVLSNQMWRQDPVAKRLVYKYAELIGINPVELELSDTGQTQQTQQAQPPQGGAQFSVAPTQQALTQNINGTIPTA